MEQLDCYRCPRSLAGEMVRVVEPQGWQYALVGAIFESRHVLARAYYGR